MNIKQIRDVKKLNNSINIIFHSYTSINLGSDALSHKFELIKKEYYSKNTNKLYNIGIYPKYYNNEINKKEHENININSQTSKSTKKNDIKDNYSTENKKIVDQFNEKEKNIINIQNGRNYSTKSLRPYPPILPQIYDYEYKLNNKQSFSKDNETLGLLNKDNIPNVFFNHLMINKRNSLFLIKHKCNRILMKKRIKNKLLNIIYYSP